ncbi:MAG: helix-turn-helix domain-containing protein [Solirubrobacteraceae bacterium]
MPDAVKPRSQDSPLRRAQAAATRLRIAETAAAVFAVRGYEGTRIEDVAAEASVAYPTVYKVFRNKPNLLKAAVDLATTGGTEGDVARQAWFRKQLEAPTANRQLRLVARNARRLYDRAGRLLETVRAAAASDDEIATLWQDIHDDRLRRSQITAKRLASKGKLRTTHAQTVRTLWTLTVPELYVVQTHTAGLTPNQYERWLADLLVTALLEP